MTAPVITSFQVYSPTTGHLIVDVNVSDDSSGSVVAIAYLYWIFDISDELDSYSIELTDGVENVTFNDLDPERPYIVELYEGYKYEYIPCKRVCLRTSLPR